TSRSRGGALVTSEPSSSRAADVTCSTARSNAGSFAREGFVKPESLRTNCSADARISSSEAGGGKVWRGLRFRHTAEFLSFPGGGDPGPGIGKNIAHRIPSHGNPGRPT